MSGDFNKNMLLIARQVRELSQENLSKRSGVTQGHLSKIEHGLTEPSGDVLTSIANTLGFPVSFFYQQDKVYGLPLSVHPMHRKKANVGKKKLDQINGEINIRLMHIDRLQQSVELESQFPLPQIDPDDYGNDIEYIAKLVRKTWLIPNGPIENVTECLEKAGILVVWCDFGEASIDGLTIKIPRRTPCIFINKNQFADRMRFTLCHELGHLVMHQTPNNGMENQANLFASAFLMPASDIRKYFRGQISLQRFASLKPIWKTSIQALLKRAGDIGAISYNQSRYLWSQINTAKIRFREPPELDFEPEHPVLLPEIIRIHMEDLDYTVTEMAKILHIHEDEFKKIYCIENDPKDDKKKKLKVVI